MNLDTLPWIAALVILALIAGAWLARRWSIGATPKIVANAEHEAWAKLEDLLEFVASSKSDQQAIAAAQRRIALRAQQVADFKAKVASL